MYFQVLLCSLSFICVFCVKVWRILVVFERDGNRKKIMIFHVGASNLTAEVSKRAAYGSDCNERLLLKKGELTVYWCLVRCLCNYF